MSFGVLARTLGPTYLSPRSSTYVRAFVSDYQNAYGAVGGNGMPVWTAGPDQPTVTVSVAPGCNDFSGETGTQVPIPAAAAAAASQAPDGPLVVDQPSTHSDWELWQARPQPDGSWQACWGGRLDTSTSNGSFPKPYGLSASGISYLGTTITEADVASGSIDHAIAVDIPACTSPPVAPANRTDCGDDPGQLPYGLRLRFPRGMTMPAGLTPFGQMVFTAVEKYGMVVTDQAGAVMIQGENASDWAAEGHSGVDPITASWAGQPEYAAVANLPWAQLQATAPWPATPAPTSLSFGVFSQPLAQAAGAAAPVEASTWVHDIVSAYQTHYGAVGVNNMPVWTVSATQTPVDVSVTPGCNDFTSFTGRQIPIPPGVTTLGYSDSPLVVDQPSTHTEWELWQAQPAAGGSWTACWGGSLNTSTSNGVFPAPSGLSASGISYLATTVTEADVASGSIDHALAVDLPGCTAPAIAPADRSDCNTDPGQPPYGTWFRLPADLAMPSGLTPFGRMVFTALQRYGMVFTDQAGAVMLQSETTADWAAEGHRGVDPITASWQGQPEYEVVANLPWSQLQVVGN